MAQKCVNFYGVSWEIALKQVTDFNKRRNALSSTVDGTISLRNELKYPISAEMCSFIEVTKQNKHLVPA